MEVDSRKVLTLEHWKQLKALDPEEKTLMGRFPRSRTRAGPETLIYSTGRLR